MAYAEVSTKLGTELISAKLVPMVTNECSKGICAGKHAIAEYLIQHEGFQLVELSNKRYPRLADDPDDDRRLQAADIRGRDSSLSSELVFECVESLLDFVTKRWKERWVTADIWEAATLDRFLQRPSSVLVSVDAPVSLRWKRFADRSVPINISSSKIGPGLSSD